MALSTRMPATAESQIPVYEDRWLIAVTSQGLQIYIYAAEASGDSDFAA